MTKTDEVLLEKRIIVLENTIRDLLYLARDGANQAFMYTRYSNVLEDYITESISLGNYTLRKGTMVGGETKKDVGGECE